MKNLEKLFCLSSQYQVLQRDHPSALIGMDGNSEFAYDDEEFDRVDLSDLALLKNDSYAYQRFYEILLQKLLLKRGEFILTEAGKKLATIVGNRLGEDQERVLDCTETGIATRDDFEAFSYDLANQSLYTEDAFQEERTALQKVFLGFFEWDGDKELGTARLRDTIPDRIEINVRDYLKETLEMGDMRDANASKLYQKYHRGYHRYRRAFSMFLLRSRQLQLETDADPITLSDPDTVFNQFRSLMHIYWQQVYLGYALEAQLEATTTFLNSRVPARYDYDELTNAASDTGIIQAEVQGILGGLDVVEGEEEASLVQLTRNLMLYGTASRTQPSVSITPTEPDSPLDLGTVEKALEEWTRNGWETIPPMANTDGGNEELLSKTIRTPLDNLRANTNDESLQFTYWSRSLARSTVLVLLELARFRYLRKNREWLYNYAYSRLNSEFASLPALEEFVSDLDPRVPIDEVAQLLLRRQVVGTHLRVFYDRLSPGNLKRMLSFDQDNRLCLETQRDRGDAPFRARISLVRFDEMNTFLRDSGLLDDDSDTGYVVSDAGANFLERTLGGEHS
jgi:hypothetical protein